MESTEKRSLAEFSIPELKKLARECTNNRFLYNAVLQMQHAKEALIVGDKKLAAMHYEKSRAYWLRSQESDADQAKHAFAKMQELGQTVKAGTYNPRLI